MSSKPVVVQGCTQVNSYGVECYSEGLKAIAIYVSQNTQFELMESSVDGTRVTSYFVFVMDGFELMKANTHASNELNSIILTYPGTV